MRLISSIQVQSFRSLKSVRINELGNFTAFAGPNNSGKSNLLRALNAFFTDYTDEDRLIDFPSDYYRPDIRRNIRRKRIRVSVTFTLPEQFGFRKGLESVRQLLAGSSFKITKEWGRDSFLPTYYLDDSELGAEDSQKIDQFLSLITFRYIPNRMLPLKLIQNEHKRLRDVLVRKVGRSVSDHSAVFQDIKRRSNTLVQDLSARLNDAVDGLGELSMAVPDSWQDIVFAMGYRFGTSGNEIEDFAQGSGVQSLLMMQTLALIDTDRTQTFGWRQGTIWAIEEPEASMHSSMEAKVASYLAEISATDNRRLQVLATTHSDLVLQYSDKIILTYLKTGRTVFEANDKRRALQTAAEMGISRWVHPILSVPLSPLVIVEGKYDYDFMIGALRLLRVETIEVAYLGVLQHQQGDGGIEHLRRYIRESAAAIRARAEGAPVIIVLDWDAARHLSSFETLVNSSDRYKVLVWPASAFNPALGESFKGLERHLSDRIVNEADRSLNVIGTTGSGQRTIGGDALGNFKRAANEVIRANLLLNDLQHSRAFIESIIAATEADTA